MGNSLKVFCNELYWVDFGVPTGSEQGGSRPALVVRSTMESPVCTVLPITKEKYKDGYDFHVDIDEIQSTVLVEQIRTIDKTRITRVFKSNGNYVHLCDSAWRDINTQLELFYRLKPLFRK